MYLTVKQQVKHLSKEEYRILQELSHTAKNLANQAIYNVRQHYFATGKYLSYEENYKILNSNMSQQILKEVDGSFKSFFGLCNLVKNGKYKSSDCKKIPSSLIDNGVRSTSVPLQVDYMPQSG